MNLLDVSISILQALQRWKSDETIENVLKDYMKVILAGLAGGPTMIHCTLKAITRVYYVSILQSLKVQGVLTFSDFWFQMAIMNFEKFYSLHTRLSVGRATNSFWGCDFRQNFG